jgi:hypothetical protein
MWARRARAFSSENFSGGRSMFEPSSAMASKASGSSQFPTPRLFKCITAGPVTNYSVQSPVINEWFRALLLCWVLLLCSVFIVYQTKLSKSTEPFDLSELSASQQDQLWTQVDNWAVAVVLANFCERWRRQTCSSSRLKTHVRSDQSITSSCLCCNNEPELRRTPLLVPLRNWGRLCVCSEYLGRTGMRYPQGWPYFSSS